MKTNFHINDKDFDNYIKLTANGNAYYFCDDLTIEFDDCENLDVDIEFVRTEDYLKFAPKTPFPKMLFTLVKWVFSPLAYIINNYFGTRLDEGYKSFDPFETNISFYIASPNEKTVNINYINSKYDIQTKKYSPPSIEAECDGIIAESKKAAFSPNILKQEWNVYHIPAFSVLIIAVLLLSSFVFSMFIKLIKDIPASSISENIMEIMGMSVCSILMTAMLIAYIFIVARAYKLYKKVVEANTKAE